MNKYTLIGLTLTTALLTACGGGGGSSDSGSGSGSGGTGSGGGSGSGGSGGSGSGGSGSGGSSDSVNGVSPITPLTKSFSRDLTIGEQEKTYSYKAGSDGDIISDLSQGYFNYKLKTGVTQIIVKDAHQKISADFTCTDGDSVKVTADEDLSTGKVVYSGTVNGTPVSCTENYNPALPFTITSGEMVDTLFDDWNDGSPNTTSCPDGLDDEVDTPFGGAVICTGTWLINRTVTDSANKTSKISQSISF